MPKDEHPVVIASNRGPISFASVDGDLVGKRGGGGLVSGLAPLVEDGRATWIAAAMTDADAQAAADGGGVATADGLSARLLSLDPAQQAGYYDVISNSTLWFVHHGLFDLTRDPSYDDTWWNAWESYRNVNAQFGRAIVEHAPRNATVLIQDYHLTLVAPEVRAERDDLRLVHFHHTPFAGPDGARVIPPFAMQQMLDGLASHDACGFHTDAWASNYRATQRRLGLRDVATFASTLSSDLGSLNTVADSDECESARQELQALADGRRVIARVDRMELSKNIVRGFDAYNRLLEQRPDLRGHVVFLACCYPSRENVPAYATYRQEVEAAAEAVNDRWGDGSWTPVTLMTDDDYVRSVALLTIYDVLLVNPIRDGLNLVAKEGPAINRNHGQLALSTQAGAWAELSDVADEVFPFDVVQTARALERCLDRAGEDREFCSSQLKELVTKRTPADWLRDQLQH